MNIVAILITLLSGISFLIGYLITKLVKDDKKLITFSVGFSFTIILGIVLFDLLPESMELLNDKWLIVLCVIAGVLLLKMLDFFIPDHSHESKTSDHMEHIGLISSLALMLHNLIEGTAIYTAAQTNVKLGLIMALGVSFHNIPLGIQISSMIKNKKEKLAIIILLIVSSIIGALVINLFNITLETIVLGILISLTLGMLIYISLFELLCEIKEHIKDKNMLYGIIIGLILIIVSMFI